MDGIIIINKEKGCTSHDVVSRIKRIFKEKVGHTGTLDPNATGVLPLLLGKGTKLSGYLIEHDKEYEVVLALGKKTETVDIEGKVIEEREVLEEYINEEKVNQVLKTFIGRQMQTPPIYSAIKVNGKKLYEYARNNEKVNIAQREIEIYKIELLEINKVQKEFSFKVACSKGTYIRSLCESIAERIGTVGYMKELNRTKVGQFTIQNSITLEELERNIDNEEYMQKRIITIEDFIQTIYGNKNSIILNENKIQLLLNGVKLTQKLEDGLYNIYNCNNKFIGIGSVENELLKREIIV